jgi:hypothetical protein
MISEAIGGYSKNQENIERVEKLIVQKYSSEPLGEKYQNIFDGLLIC